MQKYHKGGAGAEAAAREESGENIGSMRMAARLLVGIVLSLAVTGVQAGKLPDEELPALDSPYSTVGQVRCPRNSEPRGVFCDGIPIGAFHISCIWLDRVSGKPVGSRPFRWTVGHCPRGYACWTHISSEGRPNGHWQKGSKWPEPTIDCISPHERRRRLQSRSAKHKRKKKDDGAEEDDPDDAGANGNGNKRASTESSTSGSSDVQQAGPPSQGRAPGSPEIFEGLADIIPDLESWNVDLSAKLFDGHSRLITEGIETFEATLHGQTLCTSSPAAESPWQDLRDRVCLPATQVELHKDDVIQVHVGLTFPTTDVRVVWDILSQDGKGN